MTDFAANCHIWMTDQEPEAINCGGQYCRSKVKVTFSTLIQLSRFSRSSLKLWSYVERQSVGDVNLQILISLQLIFFLSQKKCSIFIATNLLKKILHESVSRFISLRPHDCQHPQTQ